MITMVFRIVLIIISIGTAYYMLKKIRQSKLQIEHAIFWLIFSAVLVLLSIFPGLAIWGARLVGIYSSTNFIFLTIFFLLIIKCFTMTIQISNLEYRIKELAQTIAIREKDKKENNSYKGIEEE